MNRREAKTLAKSITNKQLLEMFIIAMNEIKNWQKISCINPSMTKGTAWNILARDFNMNTNYHPMAKMNMIREFGEFLPENMRGLTVKANNIPALNVHHQNPDFTNYISTGEYH